MEKARGFLQKNKLLLFLLALGIVLTLLSSRSEEKETSVWQTDNEHRLAETLSRMEGVGSVSVLLSGEGSRYDVYTGAVIVCEGSDSPEIRLRILKAVSAFTGLGTDKIVVEKMILGGNDA